jgi:hypothetical protein
MAALLSFEIASKWVAFSFIARSYSGLIVSAQQPAALSSPLRQQRGEEQL